MLEGKEEDKKAKEEKQKDCMKNLELNENTTYAELTPVLQNRVRECTLRKDELVSSQFGKLIRYNWVKLLCPSNLLYFVCAFLSLVSIHYLF